MKPRLVVIVGPTASGKSGAAIDLAKAFGGEIISADSMQVYRYMDIGTAKPTMEERDGIIHYMIDIVDPDEEFNAGIYVRKSRGIIERLYKSGKNIFVVGGTGLYIKALIKGLFDTPGRNVEIRNALEMEIERFGLSALYERLASVDPDAASNIHANDRVRIIRALEVYSQTDKPISHLQKEHGFEERPYETLITGISINRKGLYQRIEKRIDGMIERGFENEVRDLFNRGYGPELKPMQSLGYKELSQYILGRLSFDDSLSLLKRNTRRYAKRQVTWFKKDESIQWRSDKDEIFGLVKSFYN